MSGRSPKRTTKLNCEWYVVVRSALGKHRQRRSVRVRRGIQVIKYGVYGIGIVRCRGSEHEEKSSLITGGVNCLRDRTSRSVLGDSTRRGLVDVLAR